MRGRISRYSEAEMKTIMYTIEDHGGNCSTAARSLNAVGIKIKAQLCNYFWRKTTPLKKGPK